MEADFANRIKSAIEQFDPGVELFLFGSRARGDFNSESDWDVMVITKEEKVTLDYEFAIREPIHDLELETGEVISLLVYTRNDWQSKQHISPLFSNVSQEGIKL